VATVVVADKQLSLAIGKEGQNARLAAKLTGWRIDIKSEAQVNEELMRRQMEQEALLEAQQIVTEAEAALEAETPVETQLDVERVEPPSAEAPTQEQAAAVVEPVTPPPTAEAPAVEEPEEELTFAEALERFEQRQAEGESDEIQEGDDERTRKLKEDRR